MYSTQNKCQNREKPVGIKEFSQMYNSFTNFNNMKEYIQKNWIEPKKQKVSTNTDSIVEKRLKNSHYTNTFEAVINTLQYIMFRHKKGIYVCFRNNKLKHYINFINNFKDWKNPYANYLELEDGVKEKIQHYFEEEKKQKEDIPNDAEILFQNKSKWYVMNNLIHGVFKIDSNTKETPFVEPDFGYYCFLELFQKLEKTYRVPDIDFFLITHDHVILHKDLQDPFPHITNKKLSHLENKYFAPILNNCTIKDFLDIPIPTQDDIARTLKIFAPPNCENPYRNNSYYHNWDTKISKAVFRGTATGYGWTPEDNKRIRLVYKNYSNVDAKLTGEDNIRFKLNSKGKVDYIPISKYDIDQSDEHKLILEEQSQYKYVIHIEGNVASFRLASLFAMKSVVIIVKSKYILWFEKLLRHKENCFIVNTIDEIYNAVKWLQKNDIKAKQIAENGYELYKNHFQLKNIKKNTINTLKLIHKYCV